MANDLEVDIKLIESKLSHSKEGNLEDAADLLRLSNSFRNRIRESSGSEMVGRLLDMLQMPIAYRLYYRRERKRLEDGLLLGNDFLECGSLFWMEGFSRGMYPAIQDFLVLVDAFPEFRSVSLFRRH